MKKSIFLSGIFSVLMTVSAFSQQPQGVTIEPTSSAKEDDWSMSRNAIKLNPLLFLRGDIPLYFEKNFNSKFSVELGAGVTTADYLAMSLEIDSTGFDNLESKIGYSFDVGFRYYASDYAFEPEGLFFGIDYRHQQYFASIDKLDYKRTNNDFRFLIGNLSNFAENAFWEPYLGLGIRQRTSSLDGSTRLNGIVPFLSCGLKIGIYFNTTY